MVFKISKILEKGKFNWKGLNNILHDHEDRIDALENDGTSGEGSFDSSSVINALMDEIGSESSEGTILYRIKQLEDNS